MNKITAVVLQILIVAFGLAVLTFLLVEPHFEGRNAHATTFEIYFNDPFLAYVYVGSSAGFYALYRAFRLLGRRRADGVWSQASVDGLLAIKRCALVLIGLVAGGGGFMLALGDKEDRPAGLAMCVIFAGASCTVAVVASFLARKLAGQSERVRL